jgi:hypothetical protein
MNLKDDTVLIPLTQGQVAVVDFADYPKVAGFHWYAARYKNTFYAQAHVGSKRRTLRMHCLLLGLPGADHKDGDGLNNRRRNLRPAKGNQNNANVHAVRAASGFKGVHWHKHRGKWVAKIRVNRRLHHLGYFVDSSEGALAYDAAAREAFGSYACLNFPKVGEQGVHPS